MPATSTTSTPPRKRSRRVVASATSVLVLAATVSAMSATPAFAVPAAGDLGETTTSPSSSLNSTTPTFKTTNDCPAGTDFIQAALNGPAGSNLTNVTALGHTDYKPGAGKVSIQLSDPL